MNKKEENLNKTVAVFVYKGKHYEIDWLTDANWPDGTRVYDLFGGKGKDATCVHQFETKSRAKKTLIALAKSAIREYCIKF